MCQLSLIDRLPGLTWMFTRDGNPHARALFDSHYSRIHYKDGRKPKLFVGPGFKIVLLSPCGRALFVWRKFIDACIDERTGEPQRGINCAIFRNDGSGILSSLLILDAERIAWERWPNERLYTYVNPKKVKSKNPGYCFVVAGWRRCGRTKSGLLIYEKLPDVLQTMSDEVGRPNSSSPTSSEVSLEQFL